jgi:3-oxoacyl-[acyl-carrier protein] reductase
MEITMAGQQGSCQLAGSVAIVTGGARGIGKAIALRLAAEGASVVIADIEGTLAAETAAEIEMHGRPALPVPTDVRAAASVDAMVAAALGRFGRIDILVNNAAIVDLPRGPYEAISEEQWDRVMQVNVKGPWLCVCAVLPVMRNQCSGKIVNLSSDMILSGIPGMLHYVASKGALTAMTRSLARELGPDGIRVNSIAPGLTTTDAAMIHGQEAAERSIRTRAIPRAETPEDITGAVVFLSSAASEFITGQLLVVNGGSVLH